MAGNFWRAIKGHFKDLVIALVILIKEAIFGVAVFSVGCLLGKLIPLFSASGNQVASLIENISDVGAIILFVVLVGNDVSEYIRKR